ncbi:hypothetical protein R3I93_012075 [Phoxinus phoxinus]|uniref:C-C motif chemokine n=1 Tax=Phoxinus phoxinus TaxID=58324 RepID=A0AAN9CXL6_9TELE
MRTRCNFIFFTLLFTFCSLARRQFRKGHTCCFSFYKRRIPGSKVERYYHITSRDCQRSAIVFITKDHRKICADPTVRWVQRLQLLVDARTWTDIKKNIMTARPIKIRSRPKTAVASSKVDRVAKKTESIRTSETSPLQRPEETTLVHLIESNNGLDFGTTQANPNTEMASESIGTRGRTRIQRADESAVVHLKE